MRKYVLILVGLIFTAFIAGCGGGSSTSATVLPGNTTVAIVEADVIGKTFTIKTPTNLLQYQLNPDKKVSWEGKTGSWQVANGNIVITEDSPGTTLQTFTRIQAESAYWLVFDTTSKKISRLYFNAAEFANFDPAFMGGADLSGGAGLLASVKVTTFAGSLPDPAGFADTAPAVVATFDQPLDITFDGTSYFVLDYNRSLIRKIDAAGNVTTRLCTDSSSGTSVAVAFNLPQGITTTKEGDFLYVADTGNHIIRKVNINNGDTITIAGAALAPGSIDAPIGANARFNFPVGITTDGTNLYVADNGNQTIRKIRISSPDALSVNAVSTLAGSPGSLGFVDGTFSAARFNSPVRLTTDGSKLYVTDFNNRTIRSVQIATGEVKTLAGNPDSKAEQVDGTGVAAHFYHPTGITTDGANLYVTDFNNIILPKPGAALADANKYNDLIRKIVISTGEVTTLAGAKNYPRIARAGDKATALFAEPRGIIWDGSSLLVTNGTYSFTTDGVTTFNSTSNYNVIFKVSP